MPPARPSYFRTALRRAATSTVQFLATYADWDDFWFQKAGLGSSAGGPALGGGVSPQTALRLSAVWACIGLLTEGLAGLPLIFYKRLENGGKERATTHALYWLLHNQPNPWQTFFEFEEMAFAHVLLRGNFYAQLVEDPASGEIRRMVPLHPDRMEVTLNAQTQELDYHYSPLQGEKYTIPARLMHHRRGRTFDGYIGISAIEYGARVFGMAQADAAYAETFFSGAGVPPVVLKTPKLLGPAGQENLRTSLDMYRRGGKFLILEEGMDAAALGVSPKDVQLLEIRQFDIEEIARIFNVPLQKLKVNKPGTVSYASAEMFDLEFVMHSIRPWAVRFEQSIWRDLLSDREQARYTAEYLLDAFLRGDSAARSNYYARALNPASGWMSKNEVRLRENLNPLEGHDDLPEPAAAPVFGRPAPAAEPDPGERDRELEDDERDPRGRPRGQAIIREAAARIQRRELAHVRRAAATCANNPAAWATWLRGFYLEAGAEYQRCLSESLCVTPADGACLAALRHATIAQDGGLATLEASAEADITALAAAALAYPLDEEIAV
jgi:HK97 family phage portal protein